jgi:hypothetical protein
MTKRTKVKRSIRSRTVSDVGTLYDFRTGKHSILELHRHATPRTDNWL